MGGGHDGRCDRWDANARIAQRVRVLRLGSLFALFLAFSCGGTVKTSSADIDVPTDAGFDTSGAGGAIAGGAAGQAAAAAGAPLEAGPGGDAGSGAAGVGGTGGSDWDAMAGAAGDSSFDGADGWLCDASQSGTGLVGEPCCPAGSRACAGHAQLLVVMCDPASLRWLEYQMCPAGQLCDSGSDPGPGTCRDQVPACEGSLPGDYVCKDADRLQCGVDLVTTTTVATCSSAEHCTLGKGPSCAACLTGSHVCEGPELQVCADDHSSYVVQQTCIDATLCDATGGQCLPYVCPAPGGPPMVQLPQGYCIDATEVTRGQYAAWLASNPPTAGQQASCSWNDDFAAQEGCMGDPSVCHGAECSQHPQVCVDWCDAVAYCKAAGKRLCGAIGGGPNDSGSWAHASKSQWFNACAAGAADLTFPYGDTYDSNACNGIGHQLGTTSPVGTLPGCTSSASGFEGVFDLSGNVSEWEDSCTAWDHCRVRGGSFVHQKDYLRCDIDLHDGRASSAQEIGFRCCAP